MTANESDMNKTKKRNQTVFGYKESSVAPSGFLLGCCFSPCNFTIITIITTTTMSPSLHLLLVSLAALSWCTSPILAQNDSFWEADLTAACGTPLNDTDCIDRHMTTIFSNLTRLYNPEGAIYSNLSYLDHHLYKPHSTVHSLNDTLASILRTYPGNYSDAEMDILKAFPRRN